MTEGNESNCICDKPKCKRGRYCDAYRLSEFIIKAKKVRHQTIAKRSAQRYQKKLYWLGEPKEDYDRCKKNYEPK